MSSTAHETESTTHTPARNLRREITLFVIVAAALGMTGGIFETSFNNFLSDTFRMGAEAAVGFEFPSRGRAFWLRRWGARSSSSPRGGSGCWRHSDRAGPGWPCARRRPLPDDDAIHDHLETGAHMMMPVSSTIALSLADRDKRALYDGPG